jgi:hypothetical protein
MRGRQTGLAAALLFVYVSWPTAVCAQPVAANGEHVNRDVGIALIVAASMLTAGGAALLYSATIPRVDVGSFIDMNNPALASGAGWALIVIGQAVAGGGIALSIVRKPRGGSRVTISRAR